MAALFQRCVRGQSRGGRFSACLTIAAVLTACIFTPGAFGDTRRILIVGDSLAAHMYLKRSLQRVLDESGLGALAVEGASTAIGGMKASHFASNYILPGSDQGLLDRIDLMLLAFPTIEIVEIWLGCNDILWESWNASFTPQQEEALLDTIQTDLQAIVTHILAVRRNLRVALCDYDYFNCVETVTPGRPEYSLFSETNWRYWGRPSPVRLNEMLVALGERKRAIAQATPGCIYVHNFGRMQHYFGYRPYFEVGEAPLPGIFPAYTPFPGGFTLFPSPPAAMDDDAVHGGKDYLHFSVKGSLFLGRDCLDRYYRPWLETPDWTFATDPEPINGMRRVSLAPVLRWRAATGALYHDVYLGNVTEGFGLVSDNQTATEYTAGPLTPGTTYYWRIDEVFPDHVEEGDYWVFFTESMEASEPSPPDGQTGTTLPLTLSWQAGMDSPLHDVYLGTDPDALDMVASEQAGTTYDAGILAFDTAYYWR
ncbi:MAG TPA: hypothetical protein PLI07_06845, partial [Candidatus Hydrogenedentes bacterium]|nr:hypothetical protein [Candidatus Hydrogenedentota bacterium]